MQCSLVELCTIPRLKDWQTGDQRNRTTTTKMAYVTLVGRVHDETIVPVAMSPCFKSLFLHFGRKQDSFLGDKKGKKIINYFAKHLTQS